MIEQVRSEREQLGPWMFGIGDDLVNPDRIGYWSDGLRWLAHEYIHHQLDVEARAR